MVSKRITAALEQIEKEENEFGSSIYASHVNIDTDELSNWISQSFGLDSLDVKDYVELSSTVNGLNFNGLTIYPINPNAENSIYAMNENWWHDAFKSKRYFFFANDDISWYSYDSQDGRYWILDLPSGTPMESFDTLSELLAVALETALL